MSGAPYIWGTEHTPSTSEVPDTHPHLGAGHTPSFKEVPDTHLLSKRHVNGAEDTMGGFYLTVVTRILHTLVTSR